VGSTGTAGANWLTYDQDAARSGVAPATPPLGRLRRSWAVRLDGAIYTQPLVDDGQVYVATEDDTVYDLAERTGELLWRRHLAVPVTSGLPCGDIDPSGITGTPVIDPTTGELYVVTFSPLPRLHHELWTLDARSGAVVASRAIDAPGSDPAAQQQRSALAILGSRVYVAFGGLDGDCSDYKGRVVGAALDGRGPLVSFTTPTARQAGIWSPPGPVVGAGSLYVATGNGSPYDAVDDSDSVLRLGPTLRLESRFTPSDFAHLSADDLDLGTTSPALVPDGKVVMVGKQGIAYLLDGTRLGGTGGDLASLPLCDGAFGGDAVEHSTVVVSCYDQLATLTVVVGPAGRARLERGWSAGGISPGPPVIAGGVVWDLTRAGRLVGYRLSDGRRVVDLAADAVVTSFPSLSASGDRLLVPEGSVLVTYTGA